MGFPPRPDRRRNLPARPALAASVARDIASDARYSRMGEA